MYGSVRPRLLEYRVDENTRRKKPPVALQNKEQLETNPTMGGLLRIKGAETARNDQPLLEHTTPQNTDFQEIQIHPENRQSLGKNDEVAPIAAPVPCNGDVKGGGGVVSGICLNPVSTFLLSQGIPTIRPSFGLNRYAGYK